MFKVAQNCPICFQPDLAYHGIEHPAHHVAIPAPYPQPPAPHGDPWYGRITRSPSPAPPPPTIPPASDTLELHLIVPSKYSGGIIGKNGSTAANIRSESGARMKVWDSISCPGGAQSADNFKNGEGYAERQHREENPSDSTWDRFIDISGDLEQVEKAINAMCDAIEVSQCHTKGRAMCIKLSVDPAQIGAVIGNKGSHIQKVRQQTGVSVKIHEPHEMPIYAPCRIVAFVGLSEKIAQAIQMCAFAIYNMAPAAIAAAAMRSHSHSLTRGGSVVSDRRQDYGPGAAATYPPHGHYLPHHPAGPAVSSVKPPPYHHHHGHGYPSDPHYQYYSEEFADRSTAPPASSLPPTRHQLPYQRSVVEANGSMISYTPPPPVPQRHRGDHHDPQQKGAKGIKGGKGSKGKGKGVKGGKAMVGAAGPVRDHENHPGGDGDSTPGSVTTSVIHLDAKTIGSVIGKKGTQIAFVRMTSGAHINIADARESTGLTREVSITGTTDQVEEKNLKENFQVLRDAKF